jgi:hypothetical protein
MHPDLLWALEKERRAELLRHHHFRQPNTDLQVDAETRQPQRRVRRSIGIAFVGIGTRLLGESRAGVDLIETRP